MSCRSAVYESNITTNRGQLLYYFRSVWHSDWACHVFISWCTCSVLNRNIVYRSKYFCCYFTQLDIYCKPPAINGGLYVPFCRSVLSLSLCISLFFCIRLHSRYVFKEPYLTMNLHSSSPTCTRLQ